MTWKLNILGLALIAGGFLELWYCPIKEIFLGVVIFCAICVIALILITREDPHDSE